MCTSSDALYFGYGSNLDVDDFARWTREAGFRDARLKLVQRAFLPDHALIFHYNSESRGGGALDVTPCRHALVPGALFTLTGDASQALDQKEGAGQRYARVSIQALTEDGAMHDAFTYRVRPDHVSGAFVAPTPAYLEIVRAGLARVGQRADALEHAAAAESTGGSDPSPPPWPAEVFVYGTLRRGQCREERMRRHRPTRVEEGWLAGKLFDLGQYPGLVLGGVDEVHGELWTYEETSALLDTLDEVEDFHGFGAPGSLYHRVLVTVRDAKGSGRVAWTYVYVGELEGARHIPSGRYGESASARISRP